MLNNTQLETTLITTPLTQAAFEKAINRLNRKAERLGVPLIKVNIIGYVDREVRNHVDVKNEEGKVGSYTTKSIVKCIQAEVSHVTVKQEGYALVGRLVPNPEGGNFIDTFDTEFNLAKFENADLCKCDHCNTKRARKFGWIVRHPSMQLMQVGSNCLKELTNGETASALELIADIYTFINQSEFDENERYSSAKDARFYNTAEVVALAIKTKAEDGWQNNERSYGEITTEGTHRLIANRIRNDYADLKATEAELADAESLIEYLLDIPEADEFIKNLQYCLTQPSIPSYKLGLVCYAPKAAEAALKKQRDTIMQAKRVFVGEIKKRYDLELTCVNTSSFEGMYGPTHINVFEDGDGNVLVWKTGGVCFNIGDTAKLKGTVKEHTEYKGTKQTILTRCKVLG